jgi:septum formation protein
MEPFTLYLASASPRRRELLAQAGIRARVEVADVPEDIHPGEAPEVYVLRVALAKAEAVRARLPADDVHPVLAADTAVVIDNEVLGKPRDRQDGLAMLSQLSGRTHHVYTGVALVDATGEAHSRLSVSAVSFRALSDAECAAYWASGEPADKAGGYGIQGRAALFIERLEGSYSGVMGLPLFETAELLRESGIDVTTDWNQGTHA